MNFSSKLSKENAESIANIYNELHSLEGELKSLRESMEAWAVKISDLEKANEEYGEFYLESAKAERRFTDGVANLLNYDFSVASRPPAGRVDK